MIIVEYAPNPTKNQPVLEPRFAEPAGAVEPQAWPCRGAQGFMGFKSLSFRV